MPLTKTGSILGPFASILGFFMDLVFRFTDLFGIFNVGLCIVLFTVIMKLLMVPLTVSQSKNSKLMNVMNPELQAIQKKYEGKTDNASMQKQSMEMQQVYDKYGVGMFSSCLPMLIQLPILFALYRVIWNIPAYVPAVKEVFSNVVTPLMTIPNYYDTVIAGVTDAESLVSQISKFDPTLSDSMIDLLYKFTNSQWSELQVLFPSISETIAENASVIEHMNSFLTLNVTDTPWTGLTSPNRAWLIPILSAVTQWFSYKMIQSQQPQQTDPNNTMASSMNMMNMIMPLFSAFICFTMPIALGIYWVTTSVVQIIQQFFINIYMDHINVDKLIEKNVEKVNKKRAKKGLPPERVSSTKAADTYKALQEQQEKEKELKEVKKEQTQKQVEASTEFYKNGSGNVDPNSLYAKAHMVEQYNEAHDKSARKHK